ncbi:hypothetical protein EG329_007713 [Mollisiaceae sp. DMI_Dod_QoI]|nr:hypothetical protein EG329_007713 [Helotiales sp. DMI_Dod_QoI]
MSLFSKMNGKETHNKGLSEDMNSSLPTVTTVMLLHHNKDTPLNLPIRLHNINLLYHKVNNGGPPPPQTPQYNTPPPQPQYGAYSPPAATLPPTPGVPQGWQPLWDPVGQRWAYLNLADNTVSWSLPAPPPVYGQQGGAGYGGYDPNPGANRYGGPAPGDYGQPPKDNSKKNLMMGAAAGAVGGLLLGGALEEHHEHNEEQLDEAREEGYEEGYDDSYD